MHELQANEAAGELNTQQRSSLKLRADIDHLSNRRVSVCDKVLVERAQLQQLDNAMFELEEQKAHLDSQVQVKRQNNAHILDSIAEIGNTRKH